MHAEPVSGNITNAERSEVESARTYSQSSAKLLDAGRMLRRPLRFQVLVGAANFLSAQAWDGLGPVG